MQGDVKFQYNDFDRHSSNGLGYNHWVYHQVYYFKCVKRINVRALIDC